MSSRVPPPPFDRILPELVDDLRSGLGADLVGAYLLGSAASGGFDPDLSDLDLLVVTARSVDEIEFDLFAGIVSRLGSREPDWAGRLDIAFIGRRTVAEFRTGGGPFVEISHEEPLEVKRRAEDWLETWYLARAADWPLTGPSAVTLIPPISTAEFLAAVVAGLDGFIAVRDEWSDGKVAYRVITLCRILRSLESGRLCSKVEGVDWAIDRYPDWGWLIGQAWESRAGAYRTGLSPEARAAVLELLGLLVSEARRAAARSGLAAYSSETTAPPPV